MIKKQNILNSNIFRITCALTIMILLLRTVDLDKLKHLFKEIDIGWLLLSCLLTVVLRILMTIRLQFILKLNEIKISLIKLIKVMFISMFFGCILPSAASADIVRGYHLFKIHGNGSIITSAIILDRFIGLYSMISLASFSAFIAAYIGFSIQIFAYLIVFQLIITVVWIFFCYHVKKNYLFLNIKNIESSKFFSKFKMILSSITNMRVLINAFPFLFSVSTLTQISRCAMFFCLYQSFGSSLHFVYFLIFIPLIFIILMIPISVGGLGIREASLIFFFQTIGITNDINLSAGVLSHFIQILLSFPFIIPLISKLVRKKNNSKSIF